MTSNTSLLGASVLLVVLVALFGYVLASRTGQPVPQQTGIANPASTNCVNLGGTLEIVDEVQGQVGFCHLQDGRICEEWSLMRGTCTPPNR